MSDTNVTSSEDNGNYVSESGVQENIENLNCTLMILSIHLLERISLDFPCSFFIKMVNGIPFSVPLSNFFETGL